MTVSSETMDHRIGASCVRSGYCCTKAPCAYGEWNAERSRCAFLVPDPSSVHGQHLCARYEEIRTQPDAWMSPAFGAGCSSSLFNERRDAVVRSLRRLEVIQR